MSKIFGGKISHWLENAAQFTGDTGSAGNKMLNNISGKVNTFLTDSTKGIGIKVDNSSLLKIGGVGAALITLWYFMTKKKSRKNR